MGCAVQLASKRASGRRGGLLSSVAALAEFRQVMFMFSMTYDFFLLIKYLINSKRRARQRWAEMVASGSGWQRPNHRRAAIKVNERFISTGHGVTADNHRCTDTRVVRSHCKHVI